MTQINRSMGEMRNLSSGMDDLRRIMTNVKTRGIVGEVQLGAILEEILSPQQYEENVAVKGDSARVEYAVRFPSEDGRSVYLPIDSKFPGDAYMQLLDAYDTGDRSMILAATDHLRRAVIKSAKDIRNKYIYPPYTTEFGIMFLPFEGLYAEVLRLDLVELLQREYRVTIAGPTTMAAILNSFQLGFRSLALQQSSGEVWETLEKVRTEFGKFNDVLEDTQHRLDQAQRDLETLVGVRTRSIQRSLDKVSDYIDD
jgi:DNA recombination protein RmuC